MTNDFYIKGYRVGFREDKGKDIEPRVICMFNEGFYFDPFSPVEIYSTLLVYKDGDFELAERVKTPDPCLMGEIGIERHQKINQARAEDLRFALQQFVNKIEEIKYRPI